MRRLSIALISVFAALPVGAQVVHTRTAAGSVAAPAASAPAPRVAVIAPPPIVLFGFQNQGVFIPNGSAVFVSLPVVVVPDGRVFADFGRGFEQIVRTCGGFTGLGGTSLVPVNQPPVIQPAVVQPTPGLPTAVATVPTMPVVQPYTPPVPNQVTASQQMLAGQQTVAIQPVFVNTQACWSMNGNGQVFITRP